MIQWQSQSDVTPGTYVCGFCGHKVRVHRGFYATDNNRHCASIFICSCGGPTFWDLRSGAQVPASLPGAAIDHLPADIGSLHGEARKSLSAGAATATVMTCRKVLMNVAVSKGDSPGKKFLEYVDYIETNGYVPPGCKPWLDAIRKTGNEVNHEIRLSDRKEAELILDFTEYLLRFAYEFPGKSSKI